MVFSHYNKICMLKMRLGAFIVADLQYALYVFLILLSVMLHKVGR